MANRELKEIVTNYAAGHINEKEMEKQVEALKTAQNGLKRKKKASGKGDTHKRKKQIKAGGKRK